MKEHLPKTRIVLADPHPLLRESVRRLLRSEEFELVGEAADVPGTLRQTCRLKPDVLVTDVTMSGADVMHAIREARHRVDGLHVLILSERIDKPLVKEAFYSGAEGYLPKRVDSDELMTAIRCVARGQPYLDAAMVEDLQLHGCFSPGHSPDILDELSSRERIVFELAAEGFSMPAIGDQMGISPRTVETHRFNLLQKLGCQSQTDLVRLAVRKGVLVP